jgi:hypothetical protein
MTRGDNDVTGTDDDATAAADGAKPNSSQTRVEAELCKNLIAKQGVHTVRLTSSDNPLIGAPILE